MSLLAPRAREIGPVRTRMVLDRSGKRWRISEMMAERTPGTPRELCLVLSSENHYHRLWSYPADWMGRPIDELLRAPKVKPRAQP
jgi:hypothetical protein